jgi:hypothetical protein
MLKRFENYTKIRQRWNFQKNHGIYEDHPVQGISEARRVREVTHTVSCPNSTERHPLIAGFVNQTGGHSYKTLFLNFEIPRGSPGIFKIS